MSQHFTDLRLNTGRGNGGEESFWPSFTDIMTVIVMIFLIAMLVLLINNMDLVKRLQATLAAERVAHEQVLSTSSLNRDLQARLAATQNQLDMLRMQLINTGEERDKLAEQLEQNRGELAASQDTARQLQDELAGERDRRSSLETQVAELSRQRDEQQQRLQSLEQDKQQAASRLAALQGDFESLKVKYDKLVRPARTAVGKYVVNVRILRQGDTIIRAVQSPQDKQFTRVSEARMFEELDKLHAAHPKDMYVRIIFPDDSGLSYAEAWTMTETLLKKYDYYYREVPLDTTNGK